MRVAFRTLGCKVNQFETGALERLFFARGHEITSWDDEADAYVINTCTVTAVSDGKSRQAIRGVKRIHPDAVTAVCGCLGQNDPEALLAVGADLVVGTGDRLGFVARVEETVRSGGRMVAVTDAAEHKDYETLPAGGVAGRTRALLKAQDGCDNYCTYCIIPHVRGPVRSLPVCDAGAEAARLEAEGFKEIVLTGIELSSYGRDLPGETGLAELIEAICRAAPGTRIRLGSLEPRVVTGLLAMRLAALPNLCPHFHLSLQSGCDQTLARMGRKYNTTKYSEALHTLRQVFPGCAVTTDLIVGFPGETEAEFERTIGYVETCSFAAMHVFPYSRRAGTPAASFSGQIAQEVKRDRAARAAMLAGEMTQAYAQSCVGRVVQVLFEEQATDGARGHAENYRPVVCPDANGSVLRGQVCPVRITGVRKGTLIGRPEGLLR